MKSHKPIIIFDLDGTLYHLRGGSYHRSPLKRNVLKNVQKYIATKLSKNTLEAKQILKNIQAEYNEQISIGLEEKYGIDRYDYFNTVWNIPASGIVKGEPNLKKTLLALHKNFKLVIVSDAPQVWITNVLKELEIDDIFRNSVFSGEGNYRKGFGNAFSNIIQTLKISAQDCIVVGDQEDIDIIPAKKFGMKTVFIHNSQRSQAADINIRLISELLTTPLVCQ